MVFESINPFTGEQLARYETLDYTAIEEHLTRAAQAFRLWRKTSFDERTRLLQKVATLLGEREEELASLATREMGKTLSEARAEVQKCAWVCRYYAEQGPGFLQPESIASDAQRSYVQYDPIGIVLAIMPWNFPYWQVFRFIAPSLMAGNVGLLKHAPNVLGCAQAMVALFAEAGLPEGAFTSLVIAVEQVEQVISDARVKAVTLTGSGPAGSAVAALAGKYLKKSVLELGGSNAFVVLADANLEKAVEIGVQARFANAGQSCIAAKRFIVHQDLAEAFTQLFVSRVEALQAGDPRLASSNMGPLARVDLAETLEAQVQRSLAAGARLLCGGKRTGALYAPTVLDSVRPGMPAADEELFGPVAAIMLAASDEEAIQLAAATPFGLGITLMTSHADHALQLAAEVEDGAVFINELVKSDPRLPFGGTKASGYGRELSQAGIREFVNVKTVYIG